MKVYVIGYVICRKYLSYRDKIFHFKIAAFLENYSIIREREYGEIFRVKKRTIRGKNEKDLMDLNKGTMML